MKGVKRGIVAVTLAGALVFAPVAGIAGQAQVTTVYAHGHHGGGHHSGGGSTYYYCGGHAAHTHTGGTCPYTADYYCGGHSAHAHADGSCPYNAYCVNSSMVRQVQTVLNDCGYNCGTPKGKWVKGKRRDWKIHRKEDGIIGKKYSRESFCFRGCFQPFI